MTVKIEIKNQSKWKSSLANAYKDPSELLKDLHLDPSQYQQDIMARKLFSMRVTKHFVKLMKPNDRQDPLLQQVIPSVKEFKTVPGFSQDPLKETTYAQIKHNNIIIKGLLQKYHGRLLIVTRPSCAIHCRYCFRRHFPYQEHQLTAENWQAIFNYIAQDYTINEVILSGGDPLMASTYYLRKITKQLDQIPHITRLRIHSRIPVVLPERIDNCFIDWLAGLHIKSILILHINHPNELSAELAVACQRLSNIGVTLFNQSVLLKGINDDAQILSTLSEKLFAIGILPYYLHTLDPVAGAAHFAVSTQRIKQIMGCILERLPGFLVPKLVTEKADDKSKYKIMSY